MLEGFVPTLLRDAPFSMMYWTLYENFKLLLSTRVSSTSKLTNDFIAGAGAGGLAAFITTPIDVIKTRRQMNAHLAHAEVRTQNKHINEDA